MTLPPNGANPQAINPPWAQIRSCFLETFEPNYVSLMLLPSFADRVNSFKLLAFAELSIASV